ncbi:MAG: LppX_LprAFG lipoprotein [Candidatus Promineifilaceae bacterium]
MIKIPSARDKFFPLTFFVFIVLLLAACREPEPESLPPETIIQRSAERMNTLSGFEFDILRSGEPVYLDLDETIAFRQAEGTYVAPDRAQAVVRIITPGLVTDVNVISIGETQWESDLLSPNWQEIPPDWGFNPAVLFDSEIGIQSILLSDLSDLALDGNEKIEDGPDQKMYVVSGSLGGEHIHAMSYGTIGPDTMSIQLWIAPETFELYRVLITDPSRGGEEPTIWQVDFREFDKTIEIEPPV